MPLCVQACQGLFNGCAMSTLMPISLGGLGGQLFTVTLRDPTAVSDCRKNLRCCYDACTVPPAAATQEENPNAPTEY